MLISCPNCATSYDVSAASLGSDGRSVRCVRCQEVWFAHAAEMSADAAGVADGMMSAAASQYRRAAGSSADRGVGASAIDDRADDDESSSSIDPNLAARAAGRSAARFADPVPAYDGAQLDDMDAAASLDAYGSPPLAPDTAAPALGATPEPADNIESVAARRRRRDVSKRGRVRRPNAATLTLALFAANAVLLGWRSDVVRLMPQTGSLFAAIGLPVNLRGLTFTDVITSREVHDGVAVLTVKGAIANVTRQPREVPRIRFAVRNDAGGEVYTWTSLPARTILAAGAAEQFETRLASPPADGQTVMVRFFNRHDLGGGGH